VADPSGTATGGAMIAAQTTHTDAVPTPVDPRLSARVPGADSFELGRCVPPSGRDITRDDDAKLQANGTALFVLAEDRSKGSASRLYDIADRIDH